MISPRQPHLTFHGTLAEVVKFAARKGNRAGTEDVDPMFHTGEQSSFQRWSRGEVATRAGNNTIQELLHFPKDWNRVQGKTGAAKVEYGGNLGVVTNCAHQLLLPRGGYETDRSLTHQVAILSRGRGTVSPRTTDR